MATYGSRAFLIATQLGRLFSSRNESSDADDMESDEEEQVTSLRASSGASQSQEEQPAIPGQFLDHELAQVTRLASSPSENVLKLTHSKHGKAINTVAMLAAREINMSGNGKFSKAEAAHMAVRYLPKDGPDFLKIEPSRLYVGQFSKDGAFFVAGYQDKRIHILDVENDWALRKRVVARNLRWTITDTALSPDQRFLVYSSITPVVHLVNVGKENTGIESLANVTDIHEGLQLNMEDQSCGIWSLKFSNDGSELLAGANDNRLYIYDLATAQTTSRINAHDDEVNAIAFADESSNVIFSGSDDQMCKVWDRRCFSSSGKCAGQLAGHLGGITFIDSRGDGRYFISNSKDQSIKLWDIRAMSSESRKSRRKPPAYRWDYRYMPFPGRYRNDKHPDDASIMTYTGHEVLRTLIRCYFSPSISTGQRFIYTGSHNGSVFIYDLITGEIVEKLKYHQTAVRDCSWHPWRPMLVSTCWDGILAKWEHLHGEKPQNAEGHERPFSIYTPHVHSDDEDLSE